MSIIIKKINKSYGKQQALKNLSFSLNKGEIVGLLGPNGAGKSTLMRIIACYLPQDNGKVLICDLDPMKDALLIKSKIGYLAENNPLYINMYIREYLDFIASVYKVQNRKQRIIEIMEKTGLISESSKRIRQLSKGFQQRVGLAAALIHDPEVLILDEPTTGLDPNQLLEIRNLIKEIGKEKTVLLSTHIMQEVEKTCTRVILLNEGKIIDDQSASSLKQKKINLENHFKELTS